VEACADEAVTAACAEERRVDAGDGIAYTRDEFVEFYGGTAEWDAAGAASSRA